MNFNWWLLTQFRIPINLNLKSINLWCESIIFSLKTFGIWIDVENLGKLGVCNKVYWIGRLLLKFGIAKRTRVFWSKRTFSFQIFFENPTSKPSKLKYHCNEKCYPNVSLKTRTFYLTCKKKIQQKRLSKIVKWKLFCVKKKDLKKG